MVAHSVSIPWSVLRCHFISIVHRRVRAGRMAVRLGQLTVFYWVNFSPGESQGESVTQDSTRVSNPIPILLRRDWDQQGLNILARNHMANGGKSLNETYLTENLYMWCVKSSHLNCSRGQLQKYIHILDMYKWISCTYGCILIIYTWHVYTHMTYIHVYIWYVQMDSTIAYIIYIINHMYAYR